ncbi:hypothetical protein [Pseudomonas sp. F01002]|uniref:hypothetical protein n=1 Tax=Pseudomonas sp. F01002 TaxID=2555724 RepID=UPI00106D9790|nr:hypothetical protein [Pseudomonas sp. F01002]TFB40923.1 hypothetical protein E3W21_12885 [Pseudomonas sp. F01002]
MKVFEVVTPGGFLDKSKGYSKDSSALLILLRDAFYEANLAVELYSESNGWRGNGKDNTLRDDDRKSRERIDAQYKALSSNGCEERQEREFNVERLHKIEQWELGRVPTEFRAAKTLIYSKAFVSALDSIGKLIKTLSKEDGAPHDLKAIAEEFYSGIPGLIGLRNSIQHVEDRAIGVFASKAKRDEESSRFFSSFVGNTYFATGKECGLDGVNVSLETLEFTLCILNKVMNSYAWVAQKQHWPSLDPWYR